MVSSLINKYLLTFLLYTHYFSVTCQKRYSYNPVRKTYIIIRFNSQPFLSFLTYKDQVKVNWFLFNHKHLPYIVANVVIHYASARSTFGTVINHIIGINLLQTVEKIKIRIIRNNFWFNSSAIIICYHQW